MHGCLLAEVTCLHTCAEVEKICRCHLLALNSHEIDFARAKEETHMDHGMIGFMAGNQAPRFSSPPRTAGSASLS